MHLYGDKEASESEEEQEAPKKESVKAKKVEEVKLVSSLASFDTVADKANSGVPMRIQETITIEYGKYKFKRVGQEEYSCSCMSWKIHGKYRGKYKTCKHVDLYLDIIEGKTDASKKAKPEKKKGDDEEDEEEEDEPKEEKKVQAKPKKAKDDKITISLMLAHVYDPDKVDPAGWYMSEKLDGVRCFWNGRNFYSRNGNKFYAPQYFKDAMPKDFHLDGELWTARDDFQNCVSIVKRQDENEEWKTIKYMVFDAPSMKSAPFTDRLKKLETVIAKQKSEYLVLHKHRLCESPEDLVKEMDLVTAEGAEGIMLREPSSKYVPSRSSQLLKVKKFEDAEVTVIGHQKGTGRLEGMMGALEVREESGIEFKIGSGFTDKQRKKPPKIGSKITFKFMGRSKAGTPRFPIFMRAYEAI